MCYNYKVEVQDSKIHGKGLFAAEDIPKGVVWKKWFGQGESKPFIGYETKPNILHTKEEL